MKDQKIAQERAKAYSELCSLVMPRPSFEEGCKISYKQGYLDRCRIGQPEVDELKEQIAKLREIWEKIKENYSETLISETYLFQNMDEALSQSQ